MEEVLHKTLPQNIQDEINKQSFNMEGAKGSDSILSSMDISQVETKNSELNAKEETNQGVNGQVDNNSESLGVCESPKSESLQHKTSSPTLIESAFKVMKNLFSPDKAKSKSGNLIGPFKQHQNVSGSPSSNIIPRKPEFVTSEPGIENALTVQTGECSIKNQLNMNQVGVLYSPLTVESHNNTDESFLTTVSIIDDSFHSAITNLDENGETVNLEINVMDSFLNNSQNLGVGNPNNETLENSDYCLENTTLRNGSFASEGTKVADISVLGKDGNEEYWNSSQINGIQNEKPLVDSMKITFDENPCDNTIQRMDVLESPKSPSILEKSHSKDENGQVVDPEESSDTIVQAKVCQESNALVKTVNMEHIFLNKSFSKPENNSASAEILSEQSDDYKSGSEVVEENKADEVNGCYKLKNEIDFRILNDESDVFLENTISTTTVVLNSVDSVELDQILMSLEDVSNPNATTPEFSSAGITSELHGNISGKQFSNEFGFTRDNKALSKETPDPKGNFTINKPQKNKSSISEKDSSGSPPNLTKMKLHKSDELINHRISSESPERRKTLSNKKSSLDVTLIKNTEASKQSSPEFNLEYKSDFVTSELNVPVGEDFKNQNHSELETFKATNQPAAVSVISQQSYTVLTTDKNLNRPIIESVNIGNVENSLEKPSFQTDNLSSTCSAETINLESCATNNYCNASLGAAHSETPSHQKQSTPLWKGKDSPSKDCRTPAKPTSVNLTSPRESVAERKSEIEHPSKADSLEKTIQMFHSNEDPADFSPVNPISENELIFLNSIEGEVGGEPCFTIADSKNTRILPSKEAAEPTQGSGKKSGLKSKKLNETVSDVMETVCNLNQTFDKKLGSPQPSPQPHQLNQTFKKKPKSPPSNKSCLSSKDTSGREKLNVTFNKCAVPPSPNKTFTKKTESLDFERSNQTFVMSESPECNEMYKTFNKNNISKEANKTFDIRGVSPGPHNLKETFATNPQSASKTTPTMGKRLSSPISPFSATNQTFVKEKEIASNSQKKVEDTSRTVQGTPGSETTEVAEIVEPQMQAMEEEKVSEKPTPDKDSAEDMPVAESADQENSDYIDGCHRETNGSFFSGRSSSTSLVGSELAALLLNEGSLSRNQSIDDLAGKLKKLDMSESSDSKQVGCEARFCGDNAMIGAPIEDSISPLDDKFRYDPYLVQLIQEQFSSNDIEKICSVVDDLSSMKLSSQILKASEQFDKSFHENFSAAEFKSLDTEMKPEESVNPLSPKSFDFLNSIQGKPTGRDLSRESLYVKFDPLVQPNPNSLIDFTKEGKTPAAAEKSPPIPEDTSVCERLLSISPQKEPDDIVPPLTPLSHKSKASKSEDKAEKLKELQNEIYFLKNLYAERERTNKAKMDDYESQVVKLTSESCFLQDRLKEANEREKSLVKKMKEQSQNLSQLKVIMEEYVKVISKLTTELETLKAENLKQIATLSTEKDSYMTHLQNTEAAFTDVHAKYEKSKKTIVSLKTNEAMYRNTIAEQSQKMEDFKARAREAQEKAMKEFEKIQEELGETKAIHSQETARLRAQLRKTELKVEALQESLEQKLKENQQLTAICDELIEGKK